jgi:hypothetical protein
MLESTLKEWEVVVNALFLGEIAVLLRKGGIHEPRFAAPPSRFLLIPTRLHQRAELLREPWSLRLQAATNNHDSTPDPQPPIRLGAEAIATHLIHHPAELESLDGLHPWSPEYATKRLRWRPKQPLTVMVLNCLRLPGERRDYPAELLAGCSSWATWEAEVSWDLATPVLSPGELSDLSALVKDRLERARRESLAVP